MEIRIKSLATALALLTIVLFAGCIGQEEEVTRTTLVIAQPNEPEILDVQQTFWSDIPNQLICQPLVDFSLDLTEIVPDMIESYDVSNDGLVITFHLMEGLKFSNGQPLDAQAVADAFWRYKEISPYAPDMEPIIEMNVIDETTIEVVNSAPPAFMWAVLASTYGAVWDAEAAAEMGDEAFGTDPVGSGPFKLKEWVHGSHITVERNENYKTNLPLVQNKGAPYLEEIKIRFIPEDLTRVSELEAGSVDLITGVPSSEVARLSDLPEIDMLDSPTPGYSYLGINNQKPPFDDVRVRRALAMAMDRDAIVTTLTGTVEPQWSFLAPAMICYSDEMEQYAKTQYSFNLEAAKALLSDAGWVDTNDDDIVDKDGEPFTAELLVPTDDPPRLKIGVVVQAMLQKLGIDASIATYEFSYIRDIIREGNYDLSLVRFSWSDPDILIYVFTDEGSNYVHYQNPDVHQKLLDARSIMDLGDRTAKYEEVQRQLIDDVAGVPLFSRLDYIAVRTWVTDLVHHRLYGNLYFNDVTIKEEEE